MEQNNLKISLALYIRLEFKICYKTLCETSHGVYSGLHIFFLFLLLNINCVSVLTSNKDYIH